MKKKVLGIMLLIAGLSLAAQAATATWDGGSTSGGWTNTANWVGDVVPVFDNTLDVYFNTAGAANLVSNWVVNNITIRSLNFTDDADANINVRLNANGSIGARSLTFGGAGGAAITSTAGAAGNFVIGAGNGTGVTLAEGLLLNHNGSGTLSIVRTVSGNFDVTNNGTGQVILSAANTYAGTVINAGTLTLSGSNSFSGSVKLNAGKLNVNNAYALGVNNFEINGGTIDNTSAAAIINSNNNTVAINGDVAFTGTQNLNLGTGATTLGTAAGTSRTITASGANDLTLGGVIANGTTANQLIKDGVGTLILNGANTYSGGLVVKQGTVNIGNNSAAGTAAVTLGDAAGGNASLVMGTFTMTNNINLAAGAAGTKTIGAGGATRNSTFTGAIALNGNNLTIKGWDSASARVTVSGGITGGGNLALTNGSTGRITLTGASINNTGSITVSGGATSGTNLIDAVIGANVTTLTLDNQAKLIVSNANAYAGGTTVSSGLLIGAAAGAFGTGGMTVADGATLILQDASTLNDLVALVLGSTSALGLDFTGADTVGSISLDGGATTLAAGTYDAAALTLLNGSGTYTGIGSLTVIPEPATI
ncbi:MAG: autotransporter-associated beta strand repeat-containing protein, partial [Kiritimatiellales bacterium]